MVKKKIYTGGFYFGYWKGHPVALSARYYPGEDSSGYCIKEIEVSEDEPFPELIDPEVTPLTIIKEICEYNDVPFLWVTGVNAGDKEAIHIMENDTVEKAFGSFIVVCSKGTTSYQYRKIFDELIKSNVIDPSLDVEVYLKNSSFIEKQALDFSKNIDYDMKIYEILKSFHSFLRGEKGPVYKTRKGDYKSKAKDPIKKEEAEPFFTALKAINPIHELIARVLYYMNVEMHLNPEKAPIVTLEGVLKLKNHDVHKHEYTNLLSLKSLEMHFGYCIDEELFERIYELAQDTNMYVFRTKKGSPIDPAQVRRSFKKASEAVKLSRVITPIHLR